MKISPQLLLFVSLLASLLLPPSTTVGQTQAKPDTSDETNVVESLGFNSNKEIPESSGLARSTFVPDAIWTLNDSGHSSKLFLLKTNGKTIGNIELKETRNVDWEAMCQFNDGRTSKLLVADVGDNLRKRKSCWIYIFPEPNFSNADPDKSAKKKIAPQKIQFAYEDGPKNCEAVCVDVAANQIWLIEKVYYDAAQKTPPGIYVLPLPPTDQDTDEPLTAKRIGDFPPRNVTGMAFSPDGKRLLIRNYVNAHLYSRPDSKTWIDVVTKSKPTTVVLPLQRQGEAVCFSDDSQSVILTSEIVRQPIWRVPLKQYFDQVTDSPNPTSEKPETVKSNNE